MAFLSIETEIVFSIAYQNALVLWVIGISDLNGIVGFHTLALVNINVLKRLVESLRIQDKIEGPFLSIV